MRTLQNYRDIYREIASNLGFRGDSVELLVQLLSSASYMGEVENIAYMQEASIERASLLNSKIQHCIDLMYSVFRGLCPRMILNIRPTKYFSLNLFDELVTSNNFKVYYIGYYAPDSSSVQGESSSLKESSKYYGNVLDGFVYAPTSFPPSDTPCQVLGIICKETVNESWTLTSSNPFYVESLESDLSNDMWVKVLSDEAGVAGYSSNTRQFYDHILNNSVFDLTLPSYGSRLYLPYTEFSYGLENTNKKVDACFFKYSELGSYNQSELKKVMVRGAEIVSFGSDLPWTDAESIYPGILTIPEVGRDSLLSIHYKANRDRYVNSILRSNTDIGTILEEYFPDYVVSSGVTYQFSMSETLNSILDIYYIPKLNVHGQEQYLTEEQIVEFKRDRLPYFLVTESDNLHVLPGTKYNVTYNIDLELFNQVEVEELTLQVDEILSNYCRKFNVNLENEEENIKASISKISGVKQIINIDFDIRTVGGSRIQDIDLIPDLTTSYFDISLKLNTTIQTKLL